MPVEFKQRYEQINTDLSNTQLELLKSKKEARQLMRRLKQVEAKLKQLEPSAVVERVPSEHASDREKNATAEEEASCVGGASVLDSLKSMMA